MKTLLRTLLAGFMLLGGSLHAQSLDPNEVLEYGDVFQISAVATARDRVDIAWDIADGY